MKSLLKSLIISEVELEDLIIRQVLISNDVGSIPLLAKIYSSQMVIPMSFAIFVGLLSSATSLTSSYKSNKGEYFSMSESPLVRDSHQRMRLCCDFEFSVGKVFSES